MDLALISFPYIHYHFPESQRHIHLLGGCQLCALCPQEGSRYHHRPYLLVVDGLVSLWEKLTTTQSKPILALNIINLSAALDLADFILTSESSESLAA